LNSHHREFELFLDANAKGFDQRMDTRKSGGRILKGSFFTAVFLSHNFINPAQCVEDIFDADGS
jgi:hypothetical protein